MLQVCTPSIDEQYTTTGAVALEIFGSTALSTADFPRLNGLITRASRWADNYIGFPLSAKIYAETVPAFGGRCLMLSRVPIRGIAGIYDSTSTGATNYSTQIRIEDAEAGLLSRDEGFAWTALQADSISESVLPNSETRPWYVIYEAGYRFDGSTTTEGGSTSTGRTLPEDLEMGVIEKVKQLYGGMAGVTSKRVGDLSITYRSEGPDPAESLLQPYRRII